MNNVEYWLNKVSKDKVILVVLHNQRKSYFTKPELMKQYFEYIPFKIEKTALNNVFIYIEA